MRVEQRAPETIRIDLRLHRQLVDRALDRKKRS
jgi:hypothetical protein